MIYVLPGVLTTDLIERLKAAFDEGEFISGAQTVGSANANRKRNEEIKAASGLRQELSEAVRKSLIAHPDFRLIAQPAHVGDILLSRYRDGMHYGDHVDNTVMGQAGGHRWRSDMSFTVFLADPASYDGGELVLNTDMRPESFKLPAGQMVLYSTLVLHRVNPVTRGERRALVGWAQSMVRDPNQRQILLDMAQTLGFIQNATRERTEHPEAIRLQKAYMNLLRMWAEI